MSPKPIRTGGSIENEGPEEPGKQVEFSLRRGKIRIANPARIRKLNELLMTDDSVRNRFSANPVAVMEEYGISITDKAIIPERIVLPKKMTDEEIKMRQEMLSKAIDQKMVAIPVAVLVVCLAVVI